MPALKRSYAYLIAVVVLAVLVTQAWKEFTRRRGNQEASFRAAQTSCGATGLLKYCVYKDPAGVNGDVVYHLPGRKLDETIWNDKTYYTAMLQAEWQGRSTPPPTVVTVSYGPSWLLTPRGARPASGLLEDFIARMPEIEARAGRPRRRILLGESMGGLNVLTAGLTYPSRFSKVAALCPGVYLDSPFGSVTSIRRAMARTGADPKIIFGIWMMARKYMTSEKEWRLVSPLSLIERASPTYPQLYVSNGLYDAYGNYEGSQELVRRARERGVVAEWRPLYGGHCAIDVPSLASFLVS